MEKTAAMHFQQVQRFSLVKKVFWVRSTLILMESCLEDGKYILTLPELCSKLYSDHLQDFVDFTLTMLK